MGHIDADERIECQQELDALEAEVAGLRARVAELERTVAERGILVERLRGSEAHYRMLIEQAADGILLIDREGHILVANRAVAEMSGYTEQELVGRRAFDLLAAEDVRARPPDHEGVAAGRTVLNERRVLRKDGSLLDTETSTRLLPDGRVQIVVRDITERKLVQSALLRESTFVQLLQEVIVSANEADSLDEAFQRCLRAICAAMDWPVGHVWARPRAADPRLRSTDLWQLADEARYGLLREATSLLSCRPGQGTLGRVLETGAPVWDAGVPLDDPSWLRREVSERVGLCACVAFPVRMGREVVAILEFFTAAPSPPDERTLKMLGNIGTQLGRACERSWAGEALQELSARMDDALRGAQVGTWSWDMEADRVVWDAQSQSIFGRRGDPTPRAYREVLERMSPPGRLLVAEAVRKSVETGRPFEVEIPVQWDDGTAHVAALRGRVHVKAGRSVRMTGVCWDTTERKEAEERIHQLAFYDSLTGLPNRRLFQQRLQAALADARTRGRQAAVIFVDLDRFKEINDTLGHRVGDELLAQVAERLVRSVRLHDVVLRGHPGERAGGPAVSRLGGDEFTMLLGDVAGPQMPGRVAERILRAFHEPFRVQEREVYVTPSIGIAIFPDDGEDVDALLASADAAMYHAKQEGANDFRFFSQELNRATARRFEIGNRLRRALGSRAFRLRYQPIVEARSGAVTGLEALLRLEDADGALSPDDFIPIAEETGLIVPIGEWVLRTACRQVQRWQRAGFPDLGVSVNLSGQQFRKPGLVESVERVLRESGIAPTKLTLEITESTIMQEDAATMGALERLAGLGVSIALDDFGTGFSSLSQLRRFPFHWLKIDRSFVREILTRPSDAALTVGIIDLAQRIGLKVVAEGVENPEQAAFLTSHGCDRLQGYGVSRPLPARRVLPFLRKNGRQGALAARARRAD